MPDDKTIGFVYKINYDANRMMIDISSWVKRDAEGPTTSEAYIATVPFKEDIVMEDANGNEIKFEDIKIDQKVALLPPVSQGEEWTASKITLLDMNKEER